MSGVLAPEVLADPIGVMVGLVEGREPVLDREIITSIAERVAGGRAKRRRIAQALLNRPTVLHDGRSPAPRAVGDLLIALNKAGARHISLPACVECGKLLRSFERRGEHWYCGVCGPRRELCAACGRLNRVSCRDRNGSPRCSQCPPNDGRDPTSDIVGLVARLDPCLPAEVIAAATRRAAPKPAQRHRLLVGTTGSSRSAHRGRGRRAGAHSPAVDRRALRRRRACHCSPGLPRLPAGDPPASAHRRKVAVPQLHRQVPCTTVCTLRSRPGGRDS